MYCKDLLLKVFDADVVEGATYDDCVALLDGAMRFRVAMSDELEDEIMTWLLNSYGPVGWPDTPRVGQLVNGYDGKFEFVAYEMPRLRQDAHVIELPAHTKEVTKVVDRFSGNKEFIEVEKHQAPGSSPIVVKTTAVEELEAPALRRQKAADNMMVAAIEATKRAIAHMLAKNAASKPESVEVKASANDTPMTIGEMLPLLKHRTPDGRWYLEAHVLVFNLEKDGQILEWSCKGIVPESWTNFEGTVRKTPAVMAPKASAS